MVRVCALEFGLCIQWWRNDAKELETINDRATCFFYICGKFWRVRGGGGGGYSNQYRGSREFDVRMIINQHPSDKCMSRESSDPSQVTRGCVADFCNFFLLLREGVGGGGGAASQ